MASRHRSFAVLIAASLLMMSGFSLLCLWTDGSDGRNEGFTWIFNGDGVIITGHGMLEYDYSWRDRTTLTLVPEGGTIDIKSNAFVNHGSLTTVTINGSVGSIGDSAFYECGSLTTVTINGSVGSIGVFAFRDCGSLTTVTINGSVGSIGTYAFRDCRSLTTVTVTGPITLPVPNTVFSACFNLKTVTVNCVVDVEAGGDGYGGIAKYATTVNKLHPYSSSYTWAEDGSACTVHLVCANNAEHNHDENATVTSEVKVQPTATEMGITEYSVSGTYDGFAYSDTKDIQDIPPITEGTVGNYHWTMDGTALTVTGNGTLVYDPIWNGLTGLTIIPDMGEVSIGDHAFDNCDSLTTFSVNGAVGSIGDCAFNDCDHLTTVVIQGPLGSIGHASFNSCDSLTSFTVQGSSGPIGDDAFCYCDALASFTVQGPIGSIGDHTFYGCDALTAFSMQGPVESIGGHAFDGCDSLNSFTVQGSVDSIDVRAFQNCNSLTAFTVNGNVGIIRSQAFLNLDSLSVLTITGPITTIEDAAFLSCINLKTLNIACNDPLGITKGSTDNGHIAEYADTVNRIHRYSATYDWADDGSACTVHIVCANDPEHNHDVTDAEISSTVKIQPTGTEKGTTEYSVTGTYDGFDYSDTKDIQDIPATGSKNNNDVPIYIASTVITVLAVAGGAFLFIRSRR